ncbi:hypothetical protein [Reichenbachiella ulvae]|uniref:AhpC/TSA family protein n=1 Tax=Reichenbachiella ulvae TaxID=2980104 RepID=A0ABT3CPA2_9BACT|nr:hypothetical protein [Reichenbachiella ulvae]MCV9385482.1 hypothetical protein [Reichenbachiella ulvae]
MKLLSLLTIITFFSFYSQAQTIGDLSLWDVQKEDIVTLNKKHDISVFVFTSTDCPYDQLYETRIQELIDQYQSKVNFFIVNAHTPRQNKENSKDTKAQAKRLDAPYYLDLDHTAKQILGIQKSPEIAIAKLDKGKWDIVYRGAIDDSPQVADDATVNYAQAVLNNLLQNKPAPHSYERAAGCRIR